MIRSHYRPRTRALATILAFVLVGVAAPPNLTNTPAPFNEYLIEGLGGGWR
jgi:hypothetical protein